jgi:hypothetical protein
MLERSAGFTGRASFSFGRWPRKCEREKVSDQITADEQILTILAKLQSALGEGGDKLETGELAQVRRILDHGETLVELARYEEAKGIVRARWRSVILGLAALVTALSMIWGKLEVTLRAILGVAQ